MIALNAASQMVALGSVLVIQTIYMIVVARVLGPEDFGRFSFAWVVVQILLIAGDLGLHNTAIRKIASGSEDSREIASLFFFLKSVLSFLLLCVILVIAFFTDESPKTRHILVVFGIGMFFHSMGFGINIVFQAHGRLYLGSFNVMFLFFCQFLVGIAAILMGGELIALSFAYVFGSLSAFLVNLVVLRKKIHPFQIRCSKDWKSFVLQSIPVGTATLFHTLSTRIAVTLLTFFSGAYHTGIYSAAVRFPQALNNIPVGIFGAILPAMAVHQKDKEPVRQLFFRSLLLMTTVSVPLSVLLYFGAEPLVTVVFGSDYSDSVRILQISAWTLIPVFVGMAFSHVILSQESLVRRLPLITGTALVVNILICVILIPRQGSIGAAWALVVTEVVLAIGYIFAASRFLRRSRAVSEEDDVRKGRNESQN